MQSVYYMYYAQSIMQIMINHDVLVNFGSVMTWQIFLPRVETRGIIEAKDSEPVTETKSM